MYTRQEQEFIKILVADDDEQVLECYLDAFGDEEPTDDKLLIDALATELFDPDIGIEDQPRFDIVSCKQGEDAVRAAAAAIEADEPFDVIILDVRMPPGIDGVEAGSQIREADPDVEIVFVTGFSDIPFDDMQRRVPPPTRLHYFNKPLSFTHLADHVVSLVKSR